MLVEYNRGKKIEGMTLWSLETYGEIVVRLKAIKYKEDSFCYFCSYLPVLGLQAAYLLTLFFRPYAFRTFVSSAERICSPKPQIPDLFYNLNLHLLSFLLTPKASFFHSDWVDQTSGIRTHCVQQAMFFTTRMVVLKA